MIEKLREYVRNMSPIVRIAVVQDFMLDAYNRGYDDAVYLAQQDLLDILYEEDEQHVNFEQIYDGHYNDHEPLE